MAMAEEPWIPFDTFATRLGTIRIHLGGWNIKRAADHCGIDDQKWRNWESGRTKPRDYPAVCRQISDRSGTIGTWLTRLMAAAATRRTGAWCWLPVTASVLCPAAHDQPRRLTTSWRCG
jgi:hypothetical protein